MRIAGGVIMLMIGSWSFVGGGCSTLYGSGVNIFRADNKGRAVRMSVAEQDKLTAGMSERDRRRFKREIGRATSRRAGHLVNGITSLLGGPLCMLAGVLFFLNRGRLLGLLATSISLAGEIVYLVLVTISIFTMIKVVLLAFGAIAATRVGAAAASQREQPAQVGPT